MFGLHMQLVFLYILYYVSYFVNCMYTSVHFAAAMAKCPHCGTNKGISYPVYLALPV